MLLRGTRSDDVERAFDALAEIERLLFELEPAGLDLRVVQDVVDDVQQRIPARAHDFGELALLGVSSVSSRRPVMPITAFIGVRISWLMVARNALFACAAASASSRARSSSAT